MEKGKGSNWPLLGKIISKNPNLFRIKFNTARSSGEPLSITDFSSFAQEYAFFCLYFYQSKNNQYLELKATQCI